MVENNGLGQDSVDSACNDCEVCRESAPVDLAADPDGVGTEIANFVGDKTGRLRRQRFGKRTGFQLAGPADREEVVMKLDESHNTGGGGFCICLECNTRVPRRSWVTCIERNCPNCGAVMVREGSPCHEFFLEQGSAFHGRFDPSSRKSAKKERKGRTRVVLGHSC